MAGSPDPMPDDPQDSDSKEGRGEIPALFATIHFRGPQRPNGYTLEEIDEINRQLSHGRFRRAESCQRS